MEKEGSKPVEQPLIDKNTDQRSVSIPDHRTGYPSSNSSNSASTSDNDLASHPEGHDNGDYSNSPDHWSPICASPMPTSPALFIRPRICQTSSCSAYFLSSWIPSCR
jgi:hypothetical protein